MLTDLFNNFMMIKMIVPDCDRFCDQKWKDIIDGAFAEWHCRKDRLGVQDLMQGQIKKMHLQTLREEFL